MAAKGFPENTMEKANVWLRDAAEELGTEDRRYAHRVLRAFLHSLRDRLPLNETAQLAAQLPTLIRGEFYEGWNPSDTPQTYHQPSVFFDRLAREGVLHGETEASLASAACWRTLKRHVSGGELEDVLAVLPREFEVVLTGSSESAGSRQ